MNEWWMPLLSFCLFATSYSEWNRINGASILVRLVFVLFIMTTIPMDGVVGE